MVHISGYIFSLVCMAVLCGMILLLFDKKTSITGVMRLVLGIIMTVTVLKPLIRDDVFSFNMYTETLDTDGDWAVAAGNDYSKSLQAQIIKDRMETYILDKASQLGADIKVEILLDEDNIPVAASFCGQTSPYTKKQLRDFMHQQLAIEEECLLWE